MKKYLNNYADFNFAVYDISRYRNPFIMNMVDGKPSDGTFLVRNSGEYFSFPPMLTTDKTAISVTNHDRNLAF
ncbi:hypothetical protein [Cytobacillus sp. FSL R5-0596]|uniref:hypothetical protein n=1 Tax=Cytobacillus sp. FSL R5-0596 TaxID=2954696 RepID=UPI0030F66267